MWEEMERSPALAAPGSNDFTGLIAKHNRQTIGAKAEKFKPHAMKKQTIFARGIGY